jgi:hypothetical protein
MPLKTGTTKEDRNEIRRFYEAGERDTARIARNLKVPQRCVINCIRGMRSEAERKLEEELAAPEPETPESIQAKIDELARQQAALVNPAETPEEEDLELFDDGLGDAQVESSPVNPE